MKVIKNKQQLDAAMAELPAEYGKKLSAWWCRAQKPGKVYVISYDDVEDLAKQIDAHSEKATKRCQLRKNRGNESKQSDAEKCLAVISELAYVYGVTVKEVIKQLHAKLETAREQEQQKAFDAERAAVSKIEDFKAAHPEFIAEWEQLQAEQQKQAIRCSTLSTQIAQSKYEQRRCGRSKDKDLKSLALF